MRASNGYFEIETIYDCGEWYVLTFRGKQIGRKKMVKYDKDGSPYFMFNKVKYYLNEFIKNI